ncbi:hypothetical protein [Sphingomonas bacterium]|nr:hypothetical protein [Sphingomonas bacterium]
MTTVFAGSREDGFYSDIPGIAATLNIQPDPNAIIYGDRITTR